MRCNHGVIGVTNVFLKSSLWCFIAESWGFKKRCGNNKTKPAMRLDCVCVWWPYSLGSVWWVSVPPPQVSTYLKSVEQRTCTEGLKFHYGTPCVGGHLPPPPPTCSLSILQNMELLIRMGVGEESTEAEREMISAPNSFQSTPLRERGNWGMAQQRGRMAQWLWDIHWEWGA